MYKSVQNWVPLEEIYEDGIIKLKDNSYIKILKISPINFNLKSDFEKEAILNSYKLFLKTCNFDIQILIQSKKENIEKKLENIKNNSKKDSNKIKEISNRYCFELEKINNKNKASSKNFFIILKKYPEKLEINIIKDELNNNYFKIKECLSRCGNAVYNIGDKNEIKEILYSFFKNSEKNK